MSSSSVLTPPLEFDKLDDRAKAIFQPWEPDFRFSDVMSVERWASQIRDQASTDVFSAAAVYLSHMIRRALDLYSASKSAENVLWLADRSASIPIAVRNLSAQQQTKEWINVAADVINDSESYVRGVLDYVSYRMFLVLRQALARADATDTSNTLALLFQLSASGPLVAQQPGNQAYILASFPTDIPVSDALLKGSSSSTGGTPPMVLAYSRDFFLVNSDVWTKSSAAQAKEQQKADAKRKLNELKDRLKKEALEQVNTGQRELLRQKDEANRQLRELRALYDRQRADRDLELARQKSEIEQTKNEELARIRAADLAEKSALQAQLRQYQADLRQFQLDRNQLIELQAQNRDIERRRADAQSAIDQLQRQREIDLAEFAAKTNLNAQFAIEMDQLNKWKQRQIQSGKESNERSSSLAIITRDQQTRMNAYAIQQQAIREHPTKTPEQKAAENEPITAALVQENELKSLLNPSQQQASEAVRLLLSETYPGVDPNTIERDIIELAQQRVLEEQVRRAQDLNLRAQVAFDRWNQGIELARKEEQAKSEIDRLRADYQQKLQQKEREADTYREVYLKGKAQLDARKAYDTAYLKAQGRTQTRVAKSEGERAGNYETITKRSAERKAALQGRIEINRSQLAAAQGAEKTRIEDLIEALGALISQEDALVRNVNEAKTKNPRDDARELTIAEQNDSLERELLSLEESDAANRRLQRMKDKLDNKLKEFAQQQELRNANRRARNDMRKNRRRGAPPPAPLTRPPPAPPLNLSDRDDDFPPEPPSEPEEERLIPGRLAELRRRATREAIDWHKEITNYILEAPATLIQIIARELIAQNPRSALALPADIAAYDAEEANYYYQQIVRMMSDELAEFRNDQVFRRLVEGQLQPTDNLPNLIPVLYLEFWEKLRSLSSLQANPASPSPPVPKAPTRRTSEEPGPDTPPSKKKPAAATSSSSTTSSPAPTPAPSKRKQGDSQESNQPETPKRVTIDPTNPINADLSALSIQEEESAKDKKEDEEEAAPAVPKATITIKTSSAPVVGGEEFY